MWQPGPKKGSVLWQRWRSTVTLSPLRELNLLGMCVACTWAHTHTHLHTHSHIHTKKYTCTQTHTCTHTDIGAYTHMVICTNPHSHRHAHGPKCPFPHTLNERMHGTLVPVHILNALIPTVKLWLAIHHFYRAVCNFYTLINHLS